MYDIIWVVAVSDTDLAGSPAVPSLPSAPPSNVNIFVESVTPSFVTLIVIGNLFLLDGVFVVNTKLPLIIPVPSVNEDGANVGTVWVASVESVIVISLAVIVPLKFCWLINNSIVLSSGVVTEADANVNTWESDVNVTNLALEPAAPSVPALDLANVIVLSTFTVPADKLPLPSFTSLISR